MSTTVGVNRASLIGRDYIETIEWSVDEIETALAVAAELKADRKAGRPHRLLPDKTIYLLFLDKSTRTRNAFETGMTQLGGHAIFLDADKTQVSHGESPKDTALTLSRFGEGIAIRHDLAQYEGNAWMREIPDVGSSRPRRGAATSQTTTPATPYPPGPTMRGPGARDSWG